MLRAHRHLSRVAVAAAGLALVGGGVATTNLALAHHTVSLPTSHFEIDSDANFTADHGAPWTDWLTAAAVSKADTASGGGDESFGNGTKEDTASPSVVTGGIPPNKSDLKHFGVYQEGAGGSGFLNMYWSRVQEPTGTTNMDFEFNARQCTPKQTPADSDCTGNGLTPKRTAGDLLITYDLSQGGTNPSLSLREWSGSAWGGATNLTSSAKARGSINTSSIAAVDAPAGLGAHTPRTFGEAQIDLSAVFDDDTCESFGSVYLKSRSSDSFTAALKDFVPPAAVNISNCGSVKVIKHSASANGPRLNGATFKLYENNEPLAGPLGPEDSATTFECTTASTPTEEGTCTMTDVPLGEYWLREEEAPTGYTKDMVDQRVTLTGAAVIEKHFVNQVASVESEMSTEQRWLPNDKATITLPNDNWGDLAGTFRFELYESSNCSGAIKYSEDVSANSARDIDSGPDGGLTSTVLTANTGFYTTARTISWKVSYDPGGTRPNQVGQSGVCDVLTVSSIVNH